MQESANWCYVLHLSIDSDTDLAWSILEKEGFNPLYTDEEAEKLSKIYIKAPSDVTLEMLLNRFSFIDHIHLEELPDINWQDQWEIHAQNFHDGFLHLQVTNPIKDAWKEILLKPGAGFGDLSHPTTRLVLQMMNQDIKDQIVLDIGCGSGVLSLYAVALGAKAVFAIDIDKQALSHSYENALINHMENDLKLYLNQDFCLPSNVDRVIILMNMVMNEQLQAFDSLKAIHHLKCTCLISGILLEQKQEYIARVEKFGWTLVSETFEEGWLGLKFDM